MNKKTILIIAILVLVIIIAVCLGLGLGKKGKGEVAKLVDEYAPFEFTINYPKDAGYKFEANLESTPYVSGKIINEEKNIAITVSFDKISSSSMKDAKENASKKDNYAETKYTELGGYEYCTDENYFGKSLLNQFDEFWHIAVGIKMEKYKSSGADVNIQEFAKSKEFKSILSSITFNDKIEGKKVDGAISNNHKLIVKSIANPDESKYEVVQYPDSTGVMNKYRIKNGKYDDEGVQLRISYFGDEENYKDLATCLAYREKSSKDVFQDYSLFGHNVKVNVKKYAIGESSTPTKYKMWISGYFEKEGKVYEFLYVQYVGVEDSLGETLVNNVLNNITIQD